MTTGQQIEVFGDAILVRRMGPMARNIFAGINGNKAVAWAGFVWYRPVEQARRDILAEAVRRAA